MGFVVVLVYVAMHWVRHGMHILIVKGPKVVATSLEGGALGGVVQTVHYDEKRLSMVDPEVIRNSSIVNPVTGGFNMNGAELQGQNIRSNSISGAVVETVDHQYKLKM